MTFYKKNNILVYKSVNMVHYLKNEQNNTILDCSVKKDDLKSNINILNYTNKLLQLYIQSNYNANDFASDISNLLDIRTNWLKIEKKSSNWSSVDEFVSNELEKISKKWGLRYSSE